ncbi:MAG: hypothetical protein Q4F79_06720 [Eubacteriales bacterium]|nr:hypothetical protein [Eubacteriales bacterium]
MGLFSFLFGNRSSQNDVSEPTASIPATADSKEAVSDATMFVPRAEPSAPEEDDADDLMTAISTAVMEKTAPPHSPSDPVTEAIDDALKEPSEEERTASENDPMDTAEIPQEDPVPEEEPNEESVPISEEAPEEEAAFAEPEENDAAPEEETEQQPDTDETAEDWGSDMTEDIASQSYRRSSIPLFDDEKVRFVWKLKGTGKKRRQRVISECVKDQPVFVICNSNGSNCTIITEEGEELGRLNEQDSTVYHTLVAGNPHNLYIKKIRIKPSDKPTVKILVIVRERRKAST